MRDTLSNVLLVAAIAGAVILYSVLLLGLFKALI